MKREIWRKKERKKKERKKERKRIARSADFISISFIRKKVFK